MTDAQKRRLQEIAKWKLYSFPNGSAYKQQELLQGDHGDVTIRAVYNGCYVCTFADGSEVQVSYNRVSVGRGVDLGVYFNSRDQALADLQ